MEYACLSLRELESLTEEDAEAFEDEYLWEKYVIRLWLYRTTTKTVNGGAILGHGSGVVVVSRAA